MPPQTAYDQIEERVKKFKGLSKREFRAMEWNIDDRRAPVLAAAAGCLPAERWRPGG